jgi:uncharacterized protein (UPF0335 family)
VIIEDMIPKEGIKVLLKRIDYLEGENTQIKAKLKDIHEFIEALKELEGYEIN